MKVGVFLYNIPVVNCLPMIDSESIEFNFAAYLQVPQNCKIKELLKQISSHGADFIFLNLQRIDEKDNIL